LVALLLAVRKAGRIDAIDSQALWENRPEDLDQCHYAIALELVILL